MKISIQIPADNDIQTCRNTVMNEVQFLTIDQWYTGHEIMHAIFKEIFVIPHRKPVWKYVGCSE
jgi:hypothetical protein